MKWLRPLGMMAFRALSMAIATYHVQTSGSLFGFVAPALAPAAAPSENVSASLMRMFSVRPFKSPKSSGSICGGIKKP